MPSQRLEELIRAERAVEPEAAAEARIWAAIEHRLAHGPPPSGGADGAPGAVAGAKGGLVKLVAGLVLVAGGAGALLAGRGAEDVSADRPEIASASAGGGDVREDMYSALPEDVRGDRLPEGVGQEGGSGAATAAGGAVDSAGVPEAAGARERGDRGAAEDGRGDRSGGAAGRAGEGRAGGRGGAKGVREDRLTGTAPGEKKRGTAGPGAWEVPALETDFAAELQLIGELRGAVKRGDAVLALAKVEEHVRRFGFGGQLAQEREAYRVEALCAAGRVDAARRAAGELLAKWPDSTHAPRVKQSCAGV